jgi:hypothetical protein
MNSRGILELLISIIFISWFELLKVLTEFSSIYAKEIDLIKFYLEKCFRAFNDFNNENVNSFVLVAEFIRDTFFISYSI